MHCWLPLQELRPGAGQSVLHASRSTNRHQFSWVPTITCRWLQELRQGCRKMGFAVNDDMIVKIFDASDLDGNRVVDFREFIVVLAILYMFSTEVRSTQLASTRKRQDPPNWPLVMAKHGLPLLLLAQGTV